MVLYGFATEEERELFELLLTVQGVGPKVALAVLGGGGPREVIRTIAGGDARTLQGAPGVGKRIAERIVAELREKVGVDLPDDDGPIVVVRSDGPHELARAGLLELGYETARGRPPAGRRRGRDRRGAAGQRPAGGARMTERIQTPAALLADEELDRSLRPRRLEEFVGQPALREQLSVSIEAASARGEALDHVLLAGPPGLGKTSLAQILAAELDVPFVQTGGPGAGAQGRHRRVPDRARAAQRVLRRRAAPAAAGAGGDLLSGDGGPQAADHGRPGRRRPRRDARPAAVHARRRDDPRRAC